MGVIIPVTWPLKVGDQVRILKGGTGLDRDSIGEIFTVIMEKAISNAYPKLRGPRGNHLYIAETSITDGLVEIIQPGGNNGTQL